MKSSTLKLQVKKECGGVNKEEKEKKFSINE